MRGERYAVEATTSSTGGPQAAVVGVVVSDAFELFFDTLDSTRKAANLRRNPRVAFVISALGPGQERTVQYEGIADEPAGTELARLKQLYFQRFPDGPTRESWPGIIYLRAKPVWIRYSDFTHDPPSILEFDAPAIAKLA